LSAQAALSFSGFLFCLAEWLQSGLAVNVIVPNQIHLAMLDAVQETKLDLAPNCEPGKSRLNLG